MALLELARLQQPYEAAVNAKISSHRVVVEGKYTLYTVQVTVDTYAWTVERRYKDFDILDQQRFPDRSQSFLPPKKVVGNLDLEFINERKSELNKYMAALLAKEIEHQKQMGANSFSMPVARFFDFHEYVSQFVLNLTR
ncbi:unnamed protein product, partial [Mesorhabditis spiculigera]